LSLVEVEAVAVGWWEEGEDVWWVAVVEGEVLDWLGEEEEEAAWLWEVAEEAEVAGLKVVELPY
jgi:hypothetical protein